MAKKEGARSFGSIENRARTNDGKPDLKNPRYRARFVGADGVRRTAPETFTTKAAAEAWLRRQERDLEKAEEEGTAWVPPEVRRVELEVPTFAEFAETFLEHRDLKPSTLADYRRFLRGWLLPTFGNTRIDHITPSMVAKWYSTLPATPTQNAHIYASGRAIMRDAVRLGLVDRCPFTIPGAGQAKRASTTELPTELEIALAADSMQPAKYRLAVYLAAWCTLRSGEVRALQRGDIGLGDNVLHVRRGVTQVAEESGGLVVATPKTSYSVRDVPIPVWLAPVIREHLDAFVGPSDDAYLFSNRDGGPCRHWALYRAWDKAREVAGIPGCRFHDLRHWSATQAVVRGGASEYEARGMLGQADSKVLRRYLDKLSGRPAEIVAKMPMPDWAVLKAPVQTQNGSPMKAP